MEGGQVVLAHTHNLGVWPGQCKLCSHYVPPDSVQCEKYESHVHVCTCRAILLLYWNISDIILMIQSLL